MLTTIIKFIPGSRDGGMRAFLITLVRDGVRREFSVLAENGIQAIRQVRDLAAEPKVVA